MYLTLCLHDVTMLLVCLQDMCTVQVQNVWLKYALHMPVFLWICDHVSEQGGCHGLEEADKGWLMTMISVSGWMFLIVAAHPGCSDHSPESHKTVVCVRACMRACVCCSSLICLWFSFSVCRSALFWYSYCWNERSVWLPVCYWVASAASKLFYWKFDFCLFRYFDLWFP